MKILNTTQNSSLSETLRVAAKINKDSATILKREKGECVAVIPHGQDKFSWVWLSERCRLPKSKTAQEVAQEIVAGEWEICPDAVIIPNGISIHTPSIAIVDSRYLTVWKEDGQFRLEHRSKSGGSSYTYRFSTLERAMVEFNSLFKEGLK
jgi:hypothetical protein